MEDEERSLRHKLKKVEQEKRALKGLIERAADEIEQLAEADCSEEAISSAKAQATCLRGASSSALDQ